MTEAATGLTVGQVADECGVTVRTLHHYDEIGLVRPHRTASGYRLYTGDDLERLRHVVVYRRLGFPLEEIGPLLDDPQADVEAHLRRQRAGGGGRGGGGGGGGGGRGAPTWMHTFAGSGRRSRPGSTRGVTASRPSTEHWRHT